jgi:enoyl-CoA hydratase
MAGADRYADRKVGPPMTTDRHAEAPGDAVVAVSDDRQQATVELRNEARNNALSIAMWRQLKEILERLTTAQDLRVVVLRGAGSKAFCAGADIRDFDDKRSGDETAAYDALVEDTCRLLDEMPVPTVAMIHGYCMGAGLSLASCCDLRLCDTSAVFALPAARLGLGYTRHGIERLLRVVGLSATKYILFTARRIDAAEARTIGLAHDVVESDALPRAVDEVVADIRRNAPLTIRAMKLCMREIGKDPAERDLAACLAAIRRCNESADYAEGRRAFAEKRQPVFKGR